MYEYIADYNKKILNTDELEDKINKLFSNSISKIIFD